MHAERYAPPQSRTVSFGAAFLINGALIAGLIFAAPNVIPGGPEKRITIIPLRDPPVPPPLDEAKPVPRNERMTIQPPTAPEPYAPTRSENPTRTTFEEYPPLPPLPPVNAEPGPPTTAEPPAPLPPLIGAEQDMRFSRDFQPGYPSTELRAERDGLVRIKVLIGTDGRVRAAEAVSATSDAFFEATRRHALAKWRFKPATRGGVPQESWKTMTVRFEIKNQ